jgi:carbon starvation protein
MKKVFGPILWFVIAMLGAWAYAVLAFKRGEPLNSIYILTAALCSYAIGFRFYSKWIATRILVLNDKRATPCEVHDDGRDFVKTNKWIVFGHHFAAISGPGPLVGPVLAAQFGYLPSTLWILIGVVLGGAVQDFVILFCSMRRDGKSLGQMVKEELNNPAGYVAMLAILAIMVILLAVLALVVVKALAESPWGIFTVGATIPIAMFMGGYLRFWRVGKVLEASAIGVVLLLLAVWGGKFFHETPNLAKLFTIGAMPLAWSLIIYGLAASILPVWLLLAPRDYLSTFVKLGTIFALAFGIFLVLPQLQLPAITRFIDGTGPVVAGKLFPFCFITIACGAISGFHTLISSGTTPKIISRESYSRTIGYGAMCLESLVAIMALIAACTLDPGVYFSININGEPAETVAKVTALGFPVTEQQMDTLATDLGEKSLFGRTGGASTLAVGMAHIFSKVISGPGLPLWYHFAIMFEALFILTTIDAGTRVGRYMLQDLLGHVWKPLGETKNSAATWFASVLIVGAWGYFLIQGVRDPLGGINSLWPLFGIANQLLAAIALCLATTVILKMQLGGEFKVQGSKSKVGRPAFALITLIPLAWLLVVTMTAGQQKIFSADPRIGFLTIAKSLDQKLPDLQQAVENAKSLQDTSILKAAEKALHTNRSQHFNFLLDVAVTAIFLVMVLLIVAFSVREWILLLARKRLATLRETEPVWLPDYAVAEARPLHVVSIIALTFALVKELSGQSAVERAQVAELKPCCAEAHCDTATDKKSLEKIYVRETERRFGKNVNRCC